MHKNDAGNIQAFDQAERTLLLTNGRTYSLAPGVDMTTFRAGDYVRITYDENASGARLADSVAKSSPNHPMSAPMPEKPVPKSVMNTTASLGGKPKP